MRRTLLLTACAACAVVALKEHDFRKCNDTPFCRKHRAPPAQDGGWTVNSVRATDGALSALLVPPDEHSLPLRVIVSVLGSGATRIHVDEDPDLPLSSLETADPSVPKPAEWDDDMDGEWDAPRIRRGRAVKRRFEPSLALASADALTPVSGRCEHSIAAGDDRLRCSLEGGEAVEVRMRHSPFAISVLDGQGEPIVVLNGRSRLLFEPFRQALASESAESKPNEQHTFN
eukprot:1527282-Prymnesium_polylepis.1